MSGPGGWCTDWGAYNAPAIWEMVEAENDPQGWRQVHAWGNFEQAVAAQRRRLVACKQALTEKWPPESSEASRAFIEQLDTLIANMDESVRAASSTARGLSGIMTTLANARRELEPIRDEYDRKSTDLTPRWWDDAEDELNDRARRVMSQAEMAVRDYTPMIIPPPHYRIGVGEDAGTPFEPGGPARGGAGGAGGLVPPVPHDPPAHQPGASPVTADGRDWVPGPAGPGQPGAAAGGPGEGPGLAGVTPTGPGATPAGPTPPAGTGPGVAGPGPTGVPPAGGALPVGGVIGPGVIGPAAPAGGPAPGVAGGGASRGAAQGAARSAGAARAMPPGGVIGATPGGSAAGSRGSAGGPARGATGAAAAGSRGSAGAGGAGAGGAGAGGAGSGRTGATRGETAGTGRGGSTAPGAAGPAATPPQGATGRRGAGDDPATADDPDNPWEVASGVPPVIGPATGERRHDPGPGVIGLDP